MLFRNSIKKYGIKNFKIISYSCSEENLDWHETFLIKELNTLTPNGYNLESGGHKNKHHHETTIQKIIKNQPDRNGENNPMYGKTGNQNPFFGKQHSKKSIQLMKEKAKKHWENKINRKKASKRTKKYYKENPDAIKRMSKRRKKYYKKNPDAIKILSEKTTEYWKTHPELKEVLSNRMKKRMKGKNNPASNPVILISPKGKEYKLSCYQPFCKSHNLVVSCICKVLQNKRKHHKGWTGRYL